MAYKKPVLLADILHQTVPDSLVRGLDAVKVVNAWQAVLGPLMSRYSTNEQFSDGVLSVSIVSSVLRNELFVQRVLLIEKINDHLHCKLVRSLILR